MPRTYRNPHGYQIDPPEFRVVQRKPVPTDVLERGACVQMKGFLDLAFSEDSMEQEQAKRVCEGCPVRLACCRIAVENREQWGVWGGLTAGQREREFASIFSRTGELPIACGFCGRPFIPRRRPDMLCRRRYCDYARRLKEQGLL